MARTNVKGGGVPNNEKRTQNSKFKFKILELLFTALFKFNGHYSNSWHYLKYLALFKFGIWTVHEHSPESGSDTQTLLQLFRALAFSCYYLGTIWSIYSGWWMQDACVISMCVISEYAYADYTSQDLLQAGETQNSHGRATMLVSVLLDTHHMHR